MVLGALELSSIARGISVLDGMVKAAPVSILDVKIIQPGRYLIILTGDVASVETALRAGKDLGGDNVVDELFLPQLHPDVIPALNGKIEYEEWDAIGIIESRSATAGIEAGDKAAKAADLKLMEIRIEGEMGGKSIMKILGSIGDVEAGMEAAEEVISGKGLLFEKVIIPRPHPDIKPFIL
jgi:microcompartment protein CcmL/EutN